MIGLIMFSGILFMYMCLPVKENLVEELKTLDKSLYGTTFDDGKITLMEYDVIKNRFYKSEYEKNKLKRREKSE
jgi:hypothetical protein